MSVEIPEAYILTNQMNEVLPGKIVNSCVLADYEKLQRIGFMNKDISDYNRLIGSRIKHILSKGNVLLIQFNTQLNLVYGPEYGGLVQYQEKKEDALRKFHLQLMFDDDTYLTFRLTSMGVLHALTDKELPSSYVYKRDHLDKISPLDEETFTSEDFSRSLLGINRMLKSVLVGKGAVISGFGNSGFQEIAFLAKIHPKRKALDITPDEKHALYLAIKEIIQNRIEQGGKDQFTNLFGEKGQYKPLIGSHVNFCPQCQVEIEKIAIAGGTTFYCPNCQR
ncbi:MAG: DNA-formamidopyrimidine glycosylase family protein [Candidatus Hodarchaeales archaeon]